MNLFQKYGIKEVADVVFYSITAIGDEEFYTPVLFLDTLKVSTLEKAAEKVEAKGGKGNKKLITWNFGKEITLNLEDALFSPASMSMIWGGKLNSKLSDYTSAIVKSNLANQYGDLNYSIKAYPSPALTDDEWEIVFKVAEELGLNSGAETEYPSIYTIKDGMEEETEKYVYENRQNLIKKYFQRSWTGFDFASQKIPQVEVDSKLTNDFKFLLTGSLPKDYRGYYFDTSGIYSSENENKRKGRVYVDSLILTRQPTIDDFLTVFSSGKNYTANTPGSMIAQMSYRILLEDGSWAMANGSTTSSSDNATVFKQDILVEVRYDVQDNKILLNYINGDAVVFWLSGDNTGSTLINGWTSFVRMWRTYKKMNNPNELIKCLDPVVFLQTIYGLDAIATKNVMNTMTTTAGKAMPPEIPLKILSEIQYLNQIGTIETDIQDLEVIDRMEKCIVKDKKGLTIDPVKQKENLFRYYADDKSSSYTIYYDAKTMLPLFNVRDDMILGDSEAFTIKMGTVYYKWTRTVKYKESEDDAILGKTLVIDAETFPDAYKIVGETYIRNQKTGKDQRYQFIIHRANVSSDTSITLEAEGDPTTFSMQIDVLTPPNDIMMELKQYDVEDDPIEGGTRIVPQKSKYTYTPTNIEYIEEVAEKNKEIY